MRIAITVVVALCAAFCFALGSLIQQGAARQTHAQALRFELLVALVRQRRRLGGMAVTVLAFGIQASALAFGPLALVQPLSGPGSFSPGDSRPSLCTQVPILLANRARRGRQ